MNDTELDSTLRVGLSRSAGAHEHYPRDRLCGGVGFSRDHLIFCRRNVDNAREYEAGLSGADCADRHIVGDWGAAWLCSATSITRRTNSAKLTEQSKHHPMKKRFASQAVITIANKINWVS